MQGDPHSLQIYDCTRDQSLCWISAEEERNYISRKNEKPLPCNKMSTYAISLDGNWLTTVEQRGYKETILGTPYTEVLLKHWKRNLNSVEHEFKVHTLCKSPHERGLSIIKVCYRPGSIECATADIKGWLDNVNT
eukprot:UN34884